MKFGIVGASIGSFGEVDGLVHLAQTAESVGIESLWTVEHVVVPVGYQAPYPYSDDRKMPLPEDTPFADPYVWLAYAAAVTRTIKLGTGILILPQQHPFYVAKQAATLDRLSGGRHILGVGIGWMEDEFRALQIPFERRGAITDESIEALRDLWSPGPSKHSGGYYAWPELESNPKPLEGRVPIVIGGDSMAAARRAARLGDGYYPARADTLDACLAELEAECERIGRDPGEIEISAAGMPTRDEVKRLEDRGVSRFMFQLTGSTNEQVEKELETIGNELIG